MKQVVSQSGVIYLGLTHVQCEYISNLVSEHNQNLSYLAILTIGRFESNEIDPNS